MPRRDRYDTTASVERIELIDDGAGGFKEDVDNPTVVVASLPCLLFDPNPFHRQAIRDKEGLPDDAEIKLISCDYDSGIQLKDVLVVSATERYRLFAVTPQKSRRSTPDHLAMMGLREVL